MKVKISSFIIGIFCILTLAVSSFGQKEPAVLYSTLLSGMRLLDDGQLRIQDVRVYNLPNPNKQCRACSVNPYNPEGGGRLATTIKQDGKEIARLDWYAENMGSYWLLTAYKIAGSTASNYQIFKIASAGNYEMVFDVENKVFFRFPFKVAPFAGKNLALFGDWENYGYLIYGDANPQQQLRFSTWLRVDAPGTKVVNGDIKIIRDSDGKQIAQAFDETYRLTLNSEWKRYDFLFNHPRIRTGNNVSGGGNFFGKDLLSTDGNYTLTFDLDGKPYAKYKFTVKGGQIQFQDRQVRGSGDNTMFIEGAGAAFYLKKM